MKRIVAFIGALLLCCSFTGCEDASRASVPTYPKADPKSSWYEGSYFPHLECMTDGENYIKALQVPLGKVKISEILRVHLELYENDDLLTVGVSYAAMRPKHVERNDQLNSPEFHLAAEQLKSQVMQIRHNYTYLDYFLIVATKDQINNLTCGPDAALYVFGATGIQ